MSQRPRTPNKPKARVAPLDTIPSDVLQLLGPPPLLPTENADLYFAILAQFARSIRPDVDLITWMLIKDLADNRVEIARYRYIKATLPAVAIYNYKRNRISTLEREA